MAKPTLLIGDIGGTNARFALANPEQPGYGQVAKLACADHATALDAIATYLEQESAGTPEVICLAAAGPVVDGTVRFTNNHWRLDTEELATRFSARSVRLLNDFQAIAYSLPFLDETETQPIGLLTALPEPGTNFNVGVLGPGTGLGVAGLLGRGGEIHPIVGEGGHVGFAPETRQQIEVLEVLRQQFERVSNERLLSGPGLENIHGALCKIHGQPGARLGAAEIFALAEKREDRIAVESVKLFFEALGQVAGDMALGLGAFDGIFIAGGIVKRYPELLKASAFRSGFEHKGRHRSLTERVPTHLITHSDPGLLGAAYGALQARKRRGRRARSS